MSHSSALRPFDFHDPRRLSPPVQRALTRWHEDACKLVSDAWTSLGTFPLKVSVGGLRPRRTLPEIDALPDPATGVVFQLGHEKLPALLVIDPPRLQGLFADLLGAGDVDAEVPLTLTALEETLLDLLLSRLREALSDGWPGPAPLACVIQELCRPQRTRRITHYDEVISAAWKLECRFHSGNLTWLIPRRELESLIENDALDRRLAESESPQWTGLVEQLPLQMVVEVGQTTLSTTTMSRLEVGDVLVLDQRLAQPLTARVAGAPVWLVEPCRRGPRQAVEIQSLLND